MRTLGPFRFGSAIIALLLITSNSVAAQDSQKALFDAVARADVTTVDSMLKSGRVTERSFVDNEQNTALHLAAERCSLAMVSYLLSKNFDPVALNKWKDTPLRIAQVRCGQFSPVTGALQQKLAQSPVGPNLIREPGGLAQGNVTSVGSNLPNSRLSCVSGEWMVLSEHDAQMATRYHGASVYGRDKAQRYYVVTNRCNEMVWVFSASCSNELTVGTFQGDGFTPRYGPNELVGVHPYVGRGLLIHGEKMAVGVEWTSSGSQHKFKSQLKVFQIIYTAVQYKKDKPPPSIFGRYRDKYKTAFNNMLGHVQTNGPSYALYELQPLSALAPSILKSNHPYLKNCNSTNLVSIWESGA